MSFFNQDIKAADLSVTAIKKAITANVPSAEFNIKAESINGQKTGQVRGQIGNGKNFVYIICGNNHGIGQMWRVTSGIKDCGGEENRWYKTNDAYLSSIVNFLQTGEK